MIRQIARRMTVYVDRFNRLQGLPVTRQYETGPAWRFPAENMAAVKVGKAVRLASGLHAMLALYDRGFVMEALTLVRPHLDFVDDILLMDAGPAFGSDGTKAARQLRDAFFFEMTSADERLPAFPSRREIQSVIRKSREKKLEALAKSDLPLDPLHAHEILEELSRRRDSVGRYTNDVVHQGYDYIMSMYDPNVERFELEGTKAQILLDLCGSQIIGATNYFLVAFGVMASSRGMSDIVDEVKAFHAALEERGEQAHSRSPH